MNDAFVVDRNSWHYRWICFYNTALHRHLSSTDVDSVRWFERHRLRPSDFCQYWRMALLWPAVRMGITAISWVLTAITASHISLEGASRTGLVVLVVCLLFAAAVAATAGSAFLLDASKNTMISASRSPLIRTAYQSWKHKFCPNLEYNGREAGK